MKLKAETKDGRQVIFPAVTDIREAQRLNPTLLNWEYVM
jgi:hypothetical protein